MRTACGALETTYSVGQWAKKGEDAVVAVNRPWPGSADEPSSLSRTPSGGWLSNWEAAAAQQQPTLPSHYQLFAAFDGHNGAAAARCAADHLVPALEAHLSTAGGSGGALGSQPAAGAAGAELAGPAAELAEVLQQAVALSILELQRRVACTGACGGCTATIVLLVGRLVTVASVGSSKCVLLTGSSGPWQELTTDHILSSSPAERRRLAAAGCHVAALDAGTGGPAASVRRGDGVLRLWPGGLTLSRSIGDFNLRLSETALLPLPHIKQVLLPPTGGRLVLATDGLWSQAGEGVVRAMRGAAVKTAAHAVVKAVVSGRGGQADVSVIVADILPSGADFKFICQQQQQQRQQQQGITAPGAFQRALKLLTPARSKAAGASAAAAAAVGQVPAAAVLADYDCVAVMGLMPSPGSMLSSRSSSSSWNAGGLSKANSGGVAAGAAQQQQQPAWLDDRTRAQMLALLAEAHHLWQLARRQQQAAATAAAAAEAVAAAEATWQEAAAAAAAFQQQQQLRLHLKPHTGPAAVPSGPAAPPTPTSPCPLLRSLALGRSGSESCGLYGLGGSSSLGFSDSSFLATPRSEVGTPGAAGLLGETGASLMAPPIARRVTFAGPGLGLSRCSMPASLASLQQGNRSWSQGNSSLLHTRQWGSAPAAVPARGSGAGARPPLPARGGSLRMGSAPNTPRPIELDVGAGAEDKWMASYSRTAGMFTTAGSGRGRKQQPKGSPTPHSSYVGILAQASTNGADWPGSR